MTNCPISFKDLNFSFSEHMLFCTIRVDPLKKHELKTSFELRVIDVSSLKKPTNRQRYKSFQDGDFLNLFK